MRSTRTPAGFTLIELLIVIFIIGIVALSTTLTVGTARGGRVVLQEADKFQRILQLASQTALIEQTELGVGLWTTGYAVWQYDVVKQKWIPLTHDRALKEYSLPEPLRFSLQVADKTELLPANPKSVRAPQIWFSSTGSATVASISISNEDIVETIIINGNGEAQVVKHE